VGARADIAAAIRAEADIAVLVATSDPEEAIEVADRIFVLDSAGLRPFGDDDATREIADSSHRDGAPA
jgi:simple sugar transport system ATP-binding protein